jgi:hypothetical protein
MSKYELLYKKYRNRYLQLKGGVSAEELKAKIGERNIQQISINELDDKLNDKLQININQALVEKKIEEMEKNEEMKKISTIIIKILENEITDRTPVIENLFFSKINEEYNNSSINIDMLINRYILENSILINLLVDKIKTNELTNINKELLGNFVEKIYIYRGISNENKIKLLEKIDKLLAIIENDYKKNKFVSFKHILQALFIINSF